MRGYTHVLVTSGATKNHVAKAKIRTSEQFDLFAEDLLAERNARPLIIIGASNAQVIDRALLQDEFKANHMLSILRSGKDWDWGKRGDFKGLGGRAGALEISRRVTRKLKDESRVSTKQLFDKIMAEDSGN
jgi:hypothetical protein